MKKSILLLFPLFFSSLTQAAVTKTVNLTTAGTLSAELTTTELNTVTDLTVTGNMNACDFVTIRDNMPLLAVLDMSNVSIVAYTGVNGTLGYSESTYNTQYQLNSIPIDAFYNSDFFIAKTNLTSITLPNSVTSIGDYAFDGCTGLINLTIPNSVTSIGKYTFSGCTGLTKITIPNSVTSIGEAIFVGCTGLTSVTIPNSITTISGGAFEGCTGLISVTIPNSVTTIGNSAYDGCIGLISLTIANSVTSITMQAFYGCTGLTNLTIPNSVTSIGNASFYGCTGLTSIYANSTLPIDLNPSPGVFTYVNKTICTLYVPVGSKSAYQTANQWKDFTHIIETSNLTALPTITNTTLNIYPNPTTESFQICGFESTALITISDLNGRTLLTKQIKANENISVSSLSKGVYILEISTNERLIVKKIVKN